MTFTGTGVSITSGRGAGKTSVTIDCKEIERWCRRNRVDIPKEITRSFASACNGLKKKFANVIKHGGGECGVPRFRDFDAFTKSLRDIKHNASPLGGKLADKSSIGAWKRNGWQIIGWKDYIKRYAVMFQEGVSNGAESRLNNNGWRAYLHRRGIKAIPRTYSHNPRRVIPEPFGEFIKANLQRWAQSALWKKLARIITNRK